MVKSRIHALLSVLTAGLLSACPCDAGLSDFFADELRDDCDGLPCGWTLSAGDARFVPFLHEGEGALELAGTLSRALTAFTLADPVEEEAQVYLLARCEQATELVVSLAVDVDPPRFFEARLAAGTPTRGLPLPRHELPLALLNPVEPVEPVEPDEPDERDEEPVPTSDDRVRFRAIELRVEGPGRCTLADLHLVSTTASTCF